MEQSMSSIRTRRTITALALAVGQSLAQPCTSAGPRAAKRATTPAASPGMTTARAEGLRK